jgi:hypothetical protein
MSGTIPPLPQYAFMVWCLVKHREDFIFTFTPNTDEVLITILRVNEVKSLCLTKFHAMKTHT